VAKHVILYTPDFNLLIYSVVESIYRKTPVV